MTVNDIIKKLRSVEREQKIRYDKNAILRYNTGSLVHKKQIEFHRCQKKNRWVFGGNRSGKTQCGAVEALYFARGIHPYRKIEKALNGWVVSLSAQVQRDVVQEKIFAYINPDWIVNVVMQSGRKDSAKNGIIDYIDIKNVFGSVSRIGFKSCDQGREKFQGTGLDFVWFDEEPPKDIYDECKMRVLDVGGDIFGTMTPLKGLTFLYDEIYLNCNNDENVWHIFMQWDDNPFISKQAVEHMKSTMSKEQLRSRQYGEFIDFGGRVYGEFDERIHVVEPFNVPFDWQDIISIDPGLKNPLSAHWYCVDYDGNIYVVAEHYESEKDVIYHSKKIHSVCERLNWHTNANGMIEALIDSAALQQTLASQKSVADLFYDNGILVNAKVNKDLFSGINRVKSYLMDANGAAKLFIFSNCQNLIREFKTYYWGSGDLPVKKDDHALDELRYYIMTKPANKPDEKKNKIQLHKLSLQKRLKNVKY